MENTKLKLANNILIEIEALKECTSVSASILIAEEMTKDAKHLAELIKEEEKKSA